MLNLCYRYTKQTNWNLVVVVDMTYIKLFLKLIHRYSFLKFTVSKILHQTFIQLSTDVEEGK